MVEQWPERVSKCLVFWSYSEMVITSACHAEGPSSILGNSVKDVYCMFLQNILGVTGSIPVSPNYGTVAQNGRARGMVTARKGTHLVLADRERHCVAGGALRGVPAERGTTQRSAA